MRQPYGNCVLDDYATTERQSSKKCEEHALQQLTGKKQLKLCMNGMSQSWFWVGAYLQSAGVSPVKLCVGRL